MLGVHMNNCAQGDSPNHRQKQPLIIRILVPCILYPTIIVMFYWIVGAGLVAVSPGPLANVYLFVITLYPIVLLGSNDLSLRGEQMGVPKIIVRFIAPNLHLAFTIALGSLSVHISQAKDPGMFRDYFPPLLPMERFVALYIQHLQGK